MEIREEWLPLDTSVTDKVRVHRSYNDMADRDKIDVLGDVQHWVDLERLDIIRRCGEAAKAQPHSAQQPRTAIVRREDHLPIAEG